MRTVAGLKRKNEGCSGHRTWPHVITNAIEPSHGRLSGCDGSWWDFLWTGVGGGAGSGLEKRERPVGVRDGLGIHVVGSLPGYEF